MFDLGDELSLESYRIPWLIWIQLLILFLLIVLLYCFTISVSDPSDYASTATTAVVPTVDSTTSRFLLDDVQQVEEPSAKHDSTATSLVISRRQHTQGGQNRSIKGEVLAGTSRRIMNGEEISDGEGSSGLHLCHYFQLAKIAFLKCLGLESCDSPPTRKQRKRKDS